MPSVITATCVFGGEVEIDGRGFLGRRYTVYIIAIGPYLMYCGFGDDKVLEGMSDDPGYNHYRALGEWDIPKHLSSVFHFKNQHLNP